MIYKQFQNLKLSALCFGCMRLPTVDGNDANVNEEEAAKFKAEAEAAFPGYSVEYVDPLSLSVSCHIGDGSLAIAATRILHD